MEFQRDLASDLAFVGTVLFIFLVTDFNDLTWVNFLAFALLGVLFILKLMSWCFQFIVANFFEVIEIETDNEDDEDEKETNDTNN